MKKLKETWFIWFLVAAFVVPALMTKTGHINSYKQPVQLTHRAMWEFSR